MSWKIFFIRMFVASLGGNDVARGGICNVCLVCVCSIRFFEKKREDNYLLCRVVVVFRRCRLLLPGVGLCLMARVFLHRLRRWQWAAALCAKKRAQLGCCGLMLGIGFSDLPPLAS